MYQTLPYSPKWRRKKHEPSCPHHSFQIQRPSMTTALTPHPLSVCITSIVRVTAVSSIFPTDGSWANTYPAIWAFVETSIAIVSAYLPSTPSSIQVRNLRPQRAHQVLFRPDLWRFVWDRADEVPWQNGQVAKEGKFGGLESGGEGGERLTSRILWPRSDLQRWYVQISFIVKVAMVLYFLLIVYSYPLSKSSNT